MGNALRVDHNPLNNDIEPHSISHSSSCTTLSKLVVHLIPQSTTLAGFLLDPIKGQDRTTKAPSLELAKVSTTEESCRQRPRQVSATAP